jgi:hypothetical protein
MTQSRPEIVELRQHVGELAAAIEEWLVDHPSLLLTQRDHAIVESQGEYTAPAIAIAIAEGTTRIAEVVPVGAFVIGARGRVDVVGRVDRATLLYFESDPHIETTVRSESGSVLSTSRLSLFRHVDRPGWYWMIDARHREAAFLDRATFFEISPRSRILKSKASDALDRVMAELIAVDRGHDDRLRAVDPSRAEVEWAMENVPVRHAQRSRRDRWTRSER